MARCRILEARDIAGEEAQTRCRAPHRRGAVEPAGVEIAQPLPGEIPHLLLIAVAVRAEPQVERIADLQAIGRADDPLVDRVPPARDHCGQGRRGNIRRPVRDREAPGGKGRRLGPAGDGPALADREAKAMLGPEQREGAGKLHLG